MKPRPHTRSKPDKRLRTVAELRGDCPPQAPRMRRLDARERRALIQRLGRRRVPLLAGTVGHVLIGGDSEWSTAELWHTDVFVCAYYWERGRIRDGARLVLPSTTPVVFVTLRAAA